MTIAREIRLGLTSDIVGIFDEEEGYTEGHVYKIDQKGQDFTITYSDGTKETFTEPEGCYCDCRDYQVTIQIVPTGEYQDI